MKIISCIDFISFKNVWGSLVFYKIYKPYQCCKLYKLYKLVEVVWMSLTFGGPSNLIVFISIEGPPKAIQLISLISCIDFINLKVDKVLEAPQGL